MPASNKEYNKVQIVDENDNVIGAEFLFDALEKGAIRRASRVFVFDTDGRLLIQQRSEYVRKPLLLDQSVGGHVDEGETYQVAAVREMEEELGLKGYALQEVQLSWRNTEFFNGIYKAVVPSGTVINFDPEEVAQIIWMTPVEVDKLITTQPERCTRALVEIWQTFRDTFVS